MVDIYIYGVYLYIYMSVCVMVCIYICYMLCIYVYMVCIYMCVCAWCIYIYIYMVYICVCGVYIYIYTLNYEYISVTKASSNDRYAVCPILPVESLIAQSLYAIETLAWLTGQDVVMQYDAMWLWLQV